MQCNCYQNKAKELRKQYGINGISQNLIIETVAMPNSCFGFPVYFRIVNNNWQTEKTGFMVAKHCPFCGKRFSEPKETKSTKIVKNHEHSKSV